VRSDLQLNWLEHTVDGMPSSSASRRIFFNATISPVAYIESNVTTSGSDSGSGTLSVAL